MCTYTLQCMKKDSKEDEIISAFQAAMQAPPPKLDVQNEYVPPSFDSTQITWPEVCLHACMCVCMRVYVCLCMYVYRCVCIYVCICVCIYAK